MRSFAAAGRMADVYRALEVERSDQRRDVGGIGVHLVAVIGLRRAAVTTPVVGNHAVALREEEEQLVVPLVGRERPAVMEDERLRIARPPVLVENLRAVTGKIGRASGRERVCQYV